MRQRAASKLTERQRSVMERIDRRVPIKVIAQEMDVSETRINQHIRALKNIYGAASLNELVAIYRSTQSANPKSVADFGVGAIPTESSDQAVRRAEYSKKPAGVQFSRQDRRSTSPGHQWVPARLTRSDMPIGGDETLDVRAVFLARIATILIIALVFLVALMLAHSASRLIAEAVDDGAQTLGEPANIGAFLP